MHNVIIYAYLKIILERKDAVCIFESLKICFDDSNPYIWTIWWRINIKIFEMKFILLAPKELNIIKLTKMVQLQRRRFVFYKKKLKIFRKILFKNFHFP